MKKIILTLILGILLLGIVSAQMEYDNRKQEIEFGEAISEYGKIEIKDWFGLTKLTELELKENTELCPATGCYAKKEITMYQDGVLIDDIRFKKIQGSNMVDYQIKYKTNGEWVEYKLGEEVQGNSKGIVYEVELTGNLQGFSSVDWQIKSQGFWLEEWAVWSGSLNAGIISYWNMDDGQGTIANDNVTGIGNISLEGSVPWLTGILGDATNYSKASNQRGNASDSTPYDIGTTTDFSVSLWVKSDLSVTNTDVIIGKGVSPDGFWMITADSGLQFRMSCNTCGGAIDANSGITLGDNLWYHLVGVFDRTTGNASIYLNGTIIDSEVAIGFSAFDFSEGSKKLNFASNVNYDGYYYDGLIDEVGIWNKTLSATEITQLYNGGVGITYSPPLIDVNLIIPVDNTEQLQGYVLFNATSNPSTGNLTNSTLFIWDSDSLLENETTNTIIGETTNSTTWNVSLSADTYQWNVYSCADNDTDTNCDWGDINRTLIMNAFTENSQTFELKTYETANEEFILNITTDGSQTVSANLVYNGTSYTTTRSGTTTENIFTRTITIPTISAPGNKSFYWDVTVGSDNANSESNQQFVNFTNFNLCNSTLTNIYVNFSFKNETDSEEITNATISSSWTYYLAGDGSINKTLSFSNTTENPSYTFCFSPEDRNLNTEFIMTYNNPESQQRILTQTALFTNITTNKILYLLPTSLGLFSQFRVEDFIGNVLSGVKAVITRTLGDNIIDVSSSLTDSSGLVIFFLNPDKTYDGLFTISGFEDNSFTFVPTTDIRVVTMGSTAGEVTNGTEVSLNTTYLITPINSSLNNGTDYTFTFEVASSQSINLITMNITNSSGYQLLYDSDTSTGTLSGVVNTGNLTRIIGIYTIGTAEETLTISRLWIVGTEYEGDYSLYRQMKFFVDYGFKDFWRLLIVLVIIIGVLIFMSAGEITETSESKIIVGLLLIWAFSFIGWLDNPAVVSETGLAQFSKQYGIAILSTVGGLYFIIRRLFISRV